MSPLQNNLRLTLRSQLLGRSLNQQQPSSQLVIRRSCTQNGQRFSELKPPPSPLMNQRPLEVDVNVAYVEGREKIERGAPHQPMTQDFFLMSAGKRKLDYYAPHMSSGGFVPRQGCSRVMEIEFVLPKMGYFSFCQKDVIFLLFLFILPE